MCPAPASARKRLEPEASRLASVIHVPLPDGQVTKPPFPFLSLIDAAQPPLVKALYSTGPVTGERQPFVRVSKAPT
jgi:hypothetical protein